MLRVEWLDVTALSRGTQNTMGRAQTGYYRQSCDSEHACYYQLPFWRYAATIRLCGLRHLGRVRERHADCTGEST
jgi:hypothetical protein